MCIVCVTYEGHRSTYRISVGKPEGKDPLEMCRLRRDYNIKMYPKGVKWEFVDPILVTRDNN